MVGLGRFAGDALARPGVVVADVYRAVLRRVFCALGLLAAPVRVMHDGISAAAYGGVRGALRLAPRVGAAPLARAVPATGRAIADSPLGGLALGALNGAF